MFEQRKTMFVMETFCPENLKFLRGNKNIYACAQLNIFRINCVQEQCLTLLFPAKCNVCYYLCEEILL